MLYILTYIVTCYNPPCNNIGCTTFHALKYNKEVKEVLTNKKDLEYFCKENNVIKIDSIKIK